MTMRHGLRERLLRAGKLGRATIAPPSVAFRSVADSACANCCQSLRQCARPNEFARMRYVCSGGMMTALPIKLSPRHAFQCETLLSPPYNAPQPPRTWASVVQPEHKRRPSVKISDIASANPFAALAGEKAPTQTGVEVAPAPPVSPVPVTTHPALCPASSSGIRVTVGAHYSPKSIKSLYHFSPHASPWAALPTWVPPCQI